MSRKIRPAYHIIDGLGRCHWTGHCISQARIHVCDCSLSGLADEVLQSTSCTKWPVENMEKASIIAEHVFHIDSGGAEWFLWIMHWISVELPPCLVPCLVWCGTCPVSNVEMQWCSIRRAYCGSYACPYGIAHVIVWSIRELRISESIFLGDPPLKILSRRNYKEFHRLNLGITSRNYKESTP